MLISFNFEVHQPHRLKKAVDEHSNNIWDRYVDVKLNKEIFNRVANKCYIPANRIILDLIDEYDIKVAYSITGVFLEQAMEFNDEVLDLFKELVKTGNVELIGETYHHSLSSLFENHEEFKDDIERHRNLIKELFGYKTEVFRNTELMYNNKIAETVKEMGFKGIFTEGADRILGWRSPNYVYKALCGLNVLLRNYRLSDDIGFRFSCPDWKEYPLTADKYASWLASSPGDCINIYVDYETFGEHQWKETGIFEFLKHLPNEIEKYPNLEYAKPSEILNRCIPKGEIDVFEFSTLSWADSERDVSAWLGNRMQKLSFERLKGLRPYLGRYLSSKYGKQWESIKDDEIIEYKLYKNLQTSDNFYYQCTKGFNDMDVHSYFSHFNTPYDAYAAYMDILYDFKNHLIISHILDKYIKKIESLNLEIKSLKENNNTNNSNSSNNSNSKNNDFYEKKNEIEHLKKKLNTLENELNIKNKDIQKLKDENNKLIHELVLLNSKITNNSKNNNELNKNTTIKEKSDKVERDMDDKPKKEKNIILMNL
ncbi:Alpha-amylase [Methanothermococcus okinawensis IH1]|uniref:Alpha-amylase n=1 Tax=Methanothermococcus okinawensis (strain DSM 14208 / JCM 11175 / IH1) TaxID=647113 RepID=F8AP06_METOI|nr:polysaccharide deacetylase family protein [Methanothermococcus okinawensis]AEH07152.1 Alpha-amylase [Methanothermococcus okinawensis IH1]